MPLLQPVANLQGVEVPKPLRINKRAVSVSSSSSPPPQQHRLTLRPKAQPVPDLHEVEYPEPLRKNRRATTSPLPSPLPQPRPIQLSQPLYVDKPSISTPLPPSLAPHQHRRLELPIPLRPRLTPPSKERSVDSAHRKPDLKTPRNLSLRIKRKSTYHTTNEPATPTLPLGNNVLITTGRTPSPTSSPTSSSSRFLPLPPSPFQDEKKPRIPSNFNTNAAILPAPLTQTLANRRDIVSIPPSPPSNRQTTEIKSKWNTIRQTAPFLWNKHHDSNLEDDLQAIDEKLRETARAVVRSGEKWRRYATFLPAGRGFGNFDGTTRTSLRAVLDSHGHVGRRVGERLESEESEENRDELEGRDTIAEQGAATRELALIHLKSRRRVDRRR